MIPVDTALHIRQRWANDPVERRSRDESTTSLNDFIGSVFISHLKDGSKIIKYEKYGLLGIDEIRPNKSSSISSSKTECIISDNEFRSIANEAVNSNDTSGLFL